MASVLNKRKTKCNLKLISQLYVKDLLEIRISDCFAQRILDMFETWNNDPDVLVSCYPELGVKDKSRSPTHQKQKENEMQPKIDLPLHMGDPIWESLFEKLQQLRNDGRKVASYQIEPDKIQIELWFPHVTELMVKQKADAPKIFSDDNVTSPPVLTLSDETCQKIASDLIVRLCDPIISVGIRSCISNVLNRWAALPNDLKRGSSLAELANAVDELSLSLYGCSEGK